MDNFEYSIQISDRDWEEFYSTAEECGLMQVSLATEEELLLSDTEREDAACSTASSNPKFIRVSLCSSVGNHREPQPMQVALSPPRRSATIWTGSNDDVLSGSEDEGEFGSVTRFLCQRETLLSKNVDNTRTDIPSSETKDNFVDNCIKSLESPVYESLVECMRSLNTEMKHQYERDKEGIHERGKDYIQGRNREDIHRRVNEDIHGRGKEDINERDKEDIHGRDQEDTHGRGKEDIYERVKENIYERVKEDTNAKDTDNIHERDKENIHGKENEDTFEMGNGNIYGRGKEDILKRDKEDINERDKEDIHGRDQEYIHGRGKEDIYERVKEHTNAKDKDNICGKDKENIHGKDKENFHGKENEYTFEMGKEDIHARGREDILKRGKEDILKRDKEDICEREKEDNQGRDKDDIYERVKEDTNAEDNDTIHERDKKNILGKENEDTFEMGKEDIHGRGKEDIHKRDKEDIHERDKEDIHGRSKEDIHGRSKEDIYAKSNTSETSNGESERGHPFDSNSILVSSNDPSRTCDLLPYKNDLPDISKDNQTCIMVSGPFLPHCIPNGNIPSFKYTVEDPKMCNLQSWTSLQSSLGKYDHLTAVNDSISTKSGLHNLENPASTINLPYANVLEYDNHESILQFISKVPGDSSAVQQNIPGLLVKTLDLPNTKSSIQEPDTKVPVSLSELSPELSFDQYRLPRAECIDPVYSRVPVKISVHTMSNRSPPTQHKPPSHRSTPLTLPEMYDFFFDDVSESEIVETATNMASQEVVQELRQEATVYSPDMYEYFFLEDDENTNKSKKDTKDNKPEGASVNVEQASSPTVTASWPEACEFFFADGPQHQDREGILFTIPPSQAQRATSIFQAIAPKGLQDFTLRRVSRDRDGKLHPYVGIGTSEESNEPTTGSLVPYLSPSRSDACLMFLALASWAVKSSDLQSSEGWKTALLANIGAVSAIRYLRRRRRTWQGPSLEPVEEI